MKAYYSDGYIEHIDDSRLYVVGETAVGSAYGIRDGYDAGVDAYGIIRDGEWHESSYAEARALKNDDYAGRP